MLCSTSGKAARRKSVKLGLVATAMIAREPEVAKVWAPILNIPKILEIQSDRDEF